MMSSALNERIMARGRKLFGAISQEKPSIFDSATWTGELMEWAMANEEFKTRLFRFVDVFPVLKESEQVARHFREYFEGVQHLPPALTVGVKAAAMLGSIGGGVLAKAVSSNIHRMAGQFIIGENSDEAVSEVGRLREEGFACTVDVLGEAVLSPAESGQYVAAYLELLAALKTAQKGWPPLPGGVVDPEMDWRGAPSINISIKPSALYPLADPRDFEGSVEAILAKLEAVVSAVRECNGFLCIDMESTRMKNITLELYRRIKRLHPDYPHIGVALQSYLRDTDHDLAELLAWSVREQIPVAIRLVKGAYWDYEVVKARQNGWEPPVWTMKAESDAAFERHSRMILEHHGTCTLACASHNIRSIATVLELAKETAAPEERYEFQVLYGMAEPVRRVLLRETGRVRLYSPYGRMVPGMGYLVRRLLENSANESFLRRSFSERDDIERLLEDPAITAESGSKLRQTVPNPATEGMFSNEPSADFTQKELRESFVRNIASIRSRLPVTSPLFINGRDIETAIIFDSLNPADPGEIVGRSGSAGTGEASDAINAARKAFPKWRDTPAKKRAEILKKAAAIARVRIVELAAWQVLEIGKQWDQAYADVTEAIDFLEFYSQEALRLALPQRLSDIPGEENILGYEACGVAAVIAPWNFPLAISCGMSAAALATGNCVVYKPSSLTPVVGRQLVELFTEAGLAAGVFNYLPGPGGEIGDYLVEHPEVDLIAFTGSAEVGLGICDKAARRQGGQRVVKRVICEMGGKNAIVVDDDADLDEAIPQILQSAFGFQGQKCSACSRVIVLEGIYQQFVDRFVPAAAALSIGPAEEPAHFLGPVADQSQQQKILDYIEIGRREGAVLYESPAKSGGYYVPLVILGDIRPEHRVGQEEIFGPVLSIMRAHDFTEALAMANSTRYALTGALFSRSPANIDRAGREFRVGNLYINRGCTGALVGRQPFGGFLLSGGGTKAGGSDYLLHFLNPRVVTQNTMRRGFAPQQS